MFPLFRGGGAENKTAFSTLTTLRREEYSNCFGKVRDVVVFENLSRKEELA